MGFWARIRRLISGSGGTEETEARPPAGQVPTRRAPATTRPALLEDLLQFPAGRPLATTDIVVGLDFGTSCCKVALQSPTKLGERVVFAEFGELAHPVSAFFLPAALYEDVEGHLGLRASEATVAAHRHLKIGLLGHLRPQPEQEDPRAAMANAVAYLALVLRETRRFFLTTQNDSYGADHIRWSLNLGIPSGGYDDLDIRRRFGLVARAAWEQSLRAGPPTQVGAGEALSGVSRDARGDIEIDVVPEVVAQVVGYAKSQQRREGLHLLLDVGASTLDLCAFCLHEKERAHNSYQAPLVKWGHVRCSPSKGTLRSMRQASRRLPVSRLRFHVCGAERPLHQTLIEALPPCPPRPEGIRCWAGVGATIIASPHVLETHSYPRTVPLKREVLACALDACVAS